MVINQGDVFWIDFESPGGSEPGYRHPHVVIQNNLFNRSRINTVVVCSLTSNLKRAGGYGDAHKNIKTFKNAQLPMDNSNGSIMEIER
jgi:mRNA-degrading endonuclease toxin of MazEF toxin-antitoxin module